LNKQHAIQPNATAWYHKKNITFPDILAAVRIEILTKTQFSISYKNNLMNSYHDKIKHLWFLLTQAVA
jgi:hypothetical protein